MSVRDLPPGTCVVLFALAGIAALVAGAAAFLDGHLPMSALMVAFALVTCWGGWKSWHEGRL